MEMRVFDLKNQELTMKIRLIFVKVLSVMCDKRKFSKIKTFLILKIS